MSKDPSFLYVLNLLFIRALFFFVSWLICLGIALLLGCTVELFNWMKVASIGGKRRSWLKSRWDSWPLNLPFLNYAYWYFYWRTDLDLRSLVLLFLWWLPFDDRFEKFCFKWIFFNKSSTMFCEWPMIFCIELDPCPGTKTPGFGDAPLGKSLSDLTPKVKSLLFLTEAGIPPFLYLFILPLLMMFMSAAWDSKSS